MASFTDQPLRLQDFTSYTPQLPIDAMVQVGTYKQQQYDQGIQRIQTQIDNVAGMDVVRDVDKQYLQSKLNNLNTDLKKVAAGDFSNYQLVNSVGGMVNSIAKDKNVQNAVSSTARYRQGVAEMQTAIKDGKSSPSNEYSFQKQVQQWLQDPNVSASFDGTYKPYTNWKKNGLEVLKQLTKDETITDDAFTVDASGNIVIADAMVRKKLAGISPDKIQQALMVGLTPQDFEQMEMDGVYSYANLNTEQFLRGIQQGRNQSLSFYNDQKKVLENAKSSTTSIAEKNKLNEQIASLDRAISGISSEYDTMAASALQNLDAAKAQYFTRNSIDTFAKAFSYTETSQTLMDNPLAEAQRWREEMNMKWKQFAIQHEQRERELSLKERDTKAKEKEVEGYGGLPIGIKQEDLPVYTLDKVVQEINQSKLTVEALDSNFATSQGKDQNWLNQQKSAWEQSPSSVSPIVASHFNMTEDARRKALSDSIMVMDIQNEAIAQYGDIYQNIPKDAPSIRYRSGNTEYTYSPKDFVDFNSKLNRYISQAGPFVGSAGTGGGKGTFYDFDKAKKELSNKEYHLLEVMQGKNLSEADKTLSKHIQHWSKEINQPYSETVSKINKYTTDEISNRISVDQGVAYGIPTGKTEQRKDIANVVSRMVQLSEAPGGIANSPNFDADLATKLAVGDNTNYSLTVVEGTQRQPSMYEVTVSGKEGTTSFKLTPEQKNAVFGSRFNASPEVQMARPYLEQMNKMGGYSTSYTSGESNHNNAFLGKIDFPSVKNYGVKANIETLYPGSNQYTIKLSVFDPITKQWFDNIDYPSTGMIPENAISTALQKLNDGAIYQMINDTPATVNDLKRVEAASKKPL